MTAPSRPVALGARIAPPSAFGGLRVHRMIERNFTLFRHNWTVLLSGFVEPIFYLFAIGVGVGELVGEITLPDGSTVEYAKFVAPALLGASAMNGAIAESTFNMFFKLHYGKVYDAILATPMQPRDIAGGELAWSLFRGGLYAIGFMVVVAVFGLADSWWAVLAVPAALLIGLAFGALGMMATTFMQSWQDFDKVQMVVLPLFLFSATFYPLEVYPPALQAITRLSPLFHGVEVIRALTLGVFDWTIVVHVGVLVGLGALGLVVTSRRIGKLLLD